MSLNYLARLLYKVNNIKRENGSGKPQKKVLLLMARPLREGGGVKGWAIKEKITFFLTFFSNVPKFQRPLSSRGEGG